MKIKLEVLRPGDWIDMRYGYERRRFYVVRNDPTQEMLWLGKPEWCVSSMLSMSYAHIRNDELKPFLNDPGFAKFLADLVYICRTKRRWWWRFLVGIRDLICPFQIPRLLSGTETLDVAAVRNSK